jgi:hypothetical protein
MVNPNAFNFVPTEVWSTTTEFDALDVPIQRAVMDMNARDPRQVIDSLKKRVEHTKNGVVYAVLKGDRPSEYSSTDALVLFNQFANTATPNMLTRTEFVRLAAKEYDVRDADGKLKPVIMLASPGLTGSTLRLNKEERHLVRHGELGPAARELLRAVSERQFGHVALLGFSQGADLALAGARAAFAAHLDPQAVGAADIVGNMHRNRLRLGLDFMKAGPKDLNKAIEASGLPIQNMAFTPIEGFARFGLSTVYPTNLMLFKGLGRDVFEKRMQEILNEGIVDRIAIGYGAQSAIGRPEHLEPAIEDLYGQYGRDSFISVRVDDGNHAWGDQLTLLAKLFMRATA